LIKINWNWIKRLKAVITTISSILDNPKYIYLNQNNIFFCIFTMHQLSLYSVSKNRHAYKLFANNLINNNLFSCREFKLIWTLEIYNNDWKN